ncbi:MAG: hypothetical protein V1774_01365 [Candidatus Eisenbacteria bacterium]
MTARERFALLGIGISVIAGIVSALATLGGPTRLVDVLLLYFAGFGGGASLVALLRRTRH